MVKNIIAFIFIFTAVEWVGIRLNVLNVHFAIEKLVEFGEYPENTSKESGTEKETLQEFWICNIVKTAVDHVRNINPGHKHSIINNILLKYYPSVPTPPPNRMGCHFLS